MPFLVGSTQWLRYLYSGLCRKSQSPGGMHLPHLIHESSRMKRSWRQKFTLPRYVPMQTSLRKGPCSAQVPSADRQPPAGCPRAHHHLGCVSLPPPSAPAASLPQPNQQLHISTLFRHNPQAPLKSAHVYQPRAWGCSAKPQGWDTSLACTVVLEEWG